MTHAARPEQRYAVRAPVKVRITRQGDAVLYGDRLGIARLAGRLRHEEAGRAIVLQADEGVDLPQLVSVRQQLVRAGIPNVSMVSARTATVDVDVEAGDGASAPEAPAPPRIRMR